MRDLFEELLNGRVAAVCVGQILVKKRDDAGFVVVHRDDQAMGQLQTYKDAERAAAIAKYDDAGNYRPLKTAPNLRHGWQLQLATFDEVRRAVDCFYPGRLQAFVAWKAGRLKTTVLRETLDRQSGMYRVAAKISDPQIDDIVANFCRSDSGCLRTILWKRNRNGAIASTKLPKNKFDPLYDQSAVSTPPAAAGPANVPLLCQEACNLLVAQCRKIVKGEHS
jgi:sirohydrochlorin cobaltochelatase